MATLSDLFPALSLFTQLGRFAPARPLRTLIRTTSYKLRPPQQRLFTPTVRRAQETVLQSGAAGEHQRATVLWERSRGRVPTIVLGGFVPDATEQVFMLRGFLLKSGSVYYFNYPRHGFSNELLFAQLDDLVEELAELHGQKPVVFAVSFGGGLLMEWLKRAQRAGRKIDLNGSLIISPVACVEDLLTPGEAKPSTLLGRAVKPYLNGHASPSGVEKSRAIFSKMFESGAQNKEALRAIMTRDELHRLREAVMGAIRDINFTGACERMQSLKQMEAPGAYFSPALLPLSEAPALILYAEKESSVITENSPTRFAFETAHRAYFPRSTYRLIANQHGSPVQHASLIFHSSNFLPPISAFYKQLKPRRALQSV
ncbi:MAG TPA: alpha/beta hydrolase [Opitutaceae bacterium]|jgi:pimeloyl-ACP methyl ester carboxylesterase|nr:alpha/beta hydrolase [Opitutaceae bacterium]